MVVALPSAQEENLQPPDAAEARLIAGGVAGAVAVGGQLASLQRLMIEALTESMTGFVVPITALPRIGPEAFAQSMRRRGEMFRHRMIHFMLLTSLVLDPLPESVVSQIGEYADYGYAPTQDRRSCRVGFICKPFSPFFQNDFPRDSPYRR